METKKRFYVLISVLAFVSVLVFLLTLRVNMTGSVVLDEKVYIATLSVSDHVGFDVNGTALTFGSVPLGGSSVRKLTFANTHPFPMIVEFGVDGDISNFLFFEKAIYLESGEEKEVKVTGVVPLNETFGNYSGNFYISMRRGI